MLDAGEKPCLKIQKTYMIFSKFQAQKMKVLGSTFMLRKKRKEITERRRKIKLESEKFLIRL